MNILDFGRGVQSAVAAPRVHCEGRLTEIDGRFDSSVITGLEERGHVLKVHEENASSFRFARPGGILVDEATGALHGGVHQFTPAWAMGY